VTQQSRRKAPRLFTLVPLGCLLLVAVQSSAQAQQSVATKRALDRLFIYAVRNHNASRAVALLDQGASANARDSHGKSAIQWALQYNDPELAGLLRRHGARIGLPEAAALGDLAAVQSLLAAGADVDARGGDGATALSAAAARGDKEIVQTLLSQGAALELRDQHGRTALMCAADYRHFDVVQQLVCAGADINARDPDGRTALMIEAASPGGGPERIEALLALGADPNARDRYGWTALIWAARWAIGRDSFGDDSFGRHAALARDLVHGGARLDATDNVGWTALLTALWCGQPSIAACLLDLGASAAAAKGRSALAFVAGQRDPVLEAKLVRHGARRGVLDAIRRGDERGAVELARIGSGLRDRGGYGETPLMAAAESGFSEVVRELLKKGADPNDAEGDGLTPLVMAVAGRRVYSLPAAFENFTGDPRDSRRLEIVHDLVHAGARIDSTVQYHERFRTGTTTVLQWAIAAGSSSVVRFLLESGADVNHAGEDGVTPLMAALDSYSRLAQNFRPRPDVARMLLDRGADVTRADRDGNTALMRCVDDLEALKLLAHYDANLKHRNRRGQTLFGVAAERALYPGIGPVHSDSGAAILAWLESMGLDRRERDHYGWTLLTYAALAKDREMAAALQTEGFTLGIEDAVFLHDVEAVRQRLERGKSANRPEPDGGTLLNLAIRAGDLRIVELLIENGARVTERRRTGMSPLLYAELIADAAIVDALVKAGAE